MPTRRRNKKGAKNVRIWCGEIKPWAPFALFIDDDIGGGLVRVFDLVLGFSKGGLAEMTMAAHPASREDRAALVKALRGLGFKPKIRYDWRERYYTVAEQGIWGTISGKKF